MAEIIDLGTAGATGGFAFVAIDGGPFQLRIDVDGAHWADIGAVAAGNTFFRADPHRGETRVTVK